MSRPRVTLQITLAPTDLPTAVHTLPHQLGVWGPQVDEVLLTVDLHRSRGKYGHEWEQRLPGLRRLIDEQCRLHPEIRCLDVDYTKGTAAQISEELLGGAKVPAKDWIGGPFYSFLFGLHAPRYDHVLHLDSDMMFGGGSRTWIDEAAHMLAERDDVIVCSPLPGPPTDDGTLRSQQLDRDAHPSLAFRASRLSTRACLVDRRKWRTRLAPLPLIRPPALRALQARAEGHPRVESVELIVSTVMAARRLYRIELLGDSPGMWSVHPLYRSELFYRSLPDLIQRIEGGEVTEEQRGRYDLDDSMIDWSSARQSRVQRVRKHARVMASHLTHPLRGVPPFARYRGRTSSTDI